jgi:hypothetical protein
MKVLGRDDQGRLVRAQSKNRRAGYEGHVRVNYAVPEAEFSNDCGDDYCWRKGIETGSSSFGPFEQSSRERIAFERWLEQCLVILVGLNA